MEGFDDGWLAHFRTPVPWRVLSLYQTTGIRFVRTRTQQNRGQQGDVGLGQVAGDQHLADLAGITDVLTDVEQRADELNRRAAALLDDRP
jgi:hypothetical protein